MKRIKVLTSFKHHYININGIIGFIGFTVTLTLLAGSLPQVSGLARRTFSKLKQVSQLYASSTATPTSSNLQPPPATWIFSSGSAKSSQHLLSLWTPMLEQQWVFAQALRRTRSRP